jgi:O-6-methylguanine DNA methyltransferase
MSKPTKLTPFCETVYDVCKKIPKGKITTYKLLAKAIGKERACQAVGTALSKNPYAPIVPCHRVVNTDGSIGGFFGKTSEQSTEVKNKIKLLKSEGITVTDGKVDNFENVVYRF